MALSFTIPYALSLEQFTELTDDEPAQELLHAAYTLSEDVHRRLAELLQILDQVKQLDEKGENFDGWAAEDDVKALRHLLGEALYTCNVQLGMYDHDRVRLLRAILLCIEYEDGFDDLLCELEQIIDNLKTAISPF